MNPQILEEMSSFVTPQIVSSINTSFSRFLLRILSYLKDLAPLAQKFVSQPIMAGINQIEATVRKLNGAKTLQTTFAAIGVVLATIIGLFSVYGVENTLKSPFTMIGKKVGQLIEFLGSKTGFEPGELLESTDNALNVGLSFVSAFFENVAKPLNWFRDGLNAAKPIPEKKAWYRRLFGEATEYADLSSKTIRIITLSLVAIIVVAINYLAQQISRTADNDNEKADITAWKTLARKTATTKV